MKSIILYSALSGLFMILLFINGYSNALSPTVNQTMETSKGSVNKKIQFLLDDVSIAIQEAKMKLKSSNITAASGFLDDASTGLLQIFETLHPEARNVSNTILNISNSSMTH